MTFPGRPAALLLVAALALSGCTGSSSSSDAGSDVPGAPAASEAGTTDAPGAEGDEADIGRYVALGDSYTSAPYVGVTNVADGCLRSEQNYPALFAEANDVAELVDVSCAGATTQDLVQGQRPFGSEVVLPPQLAALTPDTDLVTIGIGGNDNGLFGRVARECTQRVSRPAGRSCVRVGDADLDAVGRNVRRTLEEVRERAPRATVVLVGYPRIVDSSACPQRLRVRDADLDTLTDLTRRLDEELADAARRAGVEYLDLHAASAGHDVCSSEPWVNGARNIPGTAMALHPLAAEQQAVATLLERELAD